MRFSIIVKLLLTVFVFIIFAGNAGFSDSIKAQRGRCGNQTFCYDGSIYPPCLPLPTTLPAVSSTYSGGYGFSVASSNCGAKRCWWFFACRCGPALGAGLCSSATSGDSSKSCSQKNVKSVK